MIDFDGKCQNVPFVTHIRAFHSALAEEEYWLALIEIARAYEHSNPRCSGYHCRRGLIFQAMGEHHKALSEYSKAGAYDKDDDSKANTLVRKAKIYHQLGFDKRTLLAYSKALELAPDRYDLHEFQAKILDELDRTREASDQRRAIVKCREKDVMNHIESANHWLWFAEACEAAGEVQKARLAYKKVIAVANSADGQYTIARIKARQRLNDL